MRGNGTGLPSESRPPAGRSLDPAGREDSETRPFAIIERDLGDGTSVLAAEGELDLASAPRLKWPLTDLLKAGRTRIVVDLSLVTFIDSTALGVLVGVHRSLPTGARFAIVCANDDVVNIFQLTGLDATFDIFATLDAALAFIRGSAAAAG